MRHPNIEELKCHDGVEKIELLAFFVCPSLLRVIMPGVKEVEERAFCVCRALNYIECGKLEIIGKQAFGGCSLSSIDLLSIRLVGDNAFAGSENLTSVKFGKELVSIRRGAFYRCPALERVTIPLKDGILADDNVFLVCEKLNHIDLVEKEVLNETVAALQMEEWKHDMNEEIDSINRILPNTPDGTFDEPGGKTQVIREWIISVLLKIIHYKAEHRRCLNEAAITLQPSLPNDIVHKNIIPFLELPSYTFEGED